MKQALLPLSSQLFSVVIWLSALFNSLHWRWIWPIFPGVSIYSASWTKDQEAAFSPSGRGGLRGKRQRRRRKEMLKKKKKKNTKRAASGGVLSQGVTNWQQNKQSCFLAWQAPSVDHCGHNNITVTAIPIDWILYIKPKMTTTTTTTTAYDTIDSWTGDTFWWWWKWTSLA